MSTDTILIIGASSALGQRYIRSIGDPTVKIIAHYNTEPAALINQKKELNLDMIMLQSNLADLDGGSKIVDFMNQHEIIPNKIIHFAAPRLKYDKFTTIDWSDVEMSFNISVRSIFIILQSCLTKMVRMRSGKIIFLLSSVVHNPPVPYLTSYTIAKSALLGLMRNLVAEYSAKGININAISPSMINTPFISDINEKIPEMFAQSHPLKRLAETDDVIPLINFLLSDGANYINGVNISISGGTSN
ncbi:MAG: SDR family oxidoreductase [Oligoflexales bacterium]|nr:SDR family oxidoreductase [Oligoflexales bacterium]